MSESFLAVVVTAATLQLVALPGEKGQLVIGSLATTYRPAAVVAGASTAFGLWTAVEILLGDALKTAFPVVYLDTVTAGLFLVFAGWLWLTASNDTTLTLGADTGADAEDILGSEGIARFIPANTSGFAPAFALMLPGEFGDKTQLVTIGLAMQYGRHPGIWLGEMLVIIPFSFATALVFDKIASRIDHAWVHRGAAGLFLVFGLDIIAEYVLGTSFLPL